MENYLSDLLSSLESIIDFLEEAPWGSGSNIYTSDISANEDLEYLESRPQEILKEIYAVSKQLDSRLLRDMEVAFISLANICDSAGKTRAALQKSEDDNWFMKHVTDTMRKAKDTLPVLRSLRSRVHQSLPTEQAISVVDKIIELVMHGPGSLYETLRSDEVQDLTARLIVWGSKYKLLDSKSQVWLFWGDCDLLNLQRYCDPESEYFKDFGASLCAELRIVRENARLLSGETESTEAARDGRTRSELLESIRTAARDLEKATEPELDLGSLSNNETAYADAVVIEYLTDRFGEQDDALGNWPADWYECPEAFELWKSTIKKYRRHKAKASFDKVEIAAEQVVAEKGTTAGESEMAPHDESREDIAADRRSVPLSLTRMAQYWGGEMTPKKLRALIDRGTLPVMQLSRQTYIFDTKYLPSHVIEKVKR
jgi:hypothetical protein